MSNNLLSYATHNLNVLSMAVLSVIIMQHNRLGYGHLSVLKFPEF